jgi:DNA-binding response OmpR family regulator
MKILVVHRQKLVVDQLKSVLHDNSPVVIYTDSGLDGLLTSRIESFDLIICGTDLPVITGFEFVRALRSNSENKNVPVIFIADKVNQKTQHLGSVLSLLSSQNLDNHLTNIVHDQMRLKADERPENLTSKIALN